MCRRNMSREESPEITVLLEKPSPLVVNSKVINNEVGYKEVNLNNNLRNNSCDENVKNSICVISEVVGNATKTFMQSKPCDTQPQLLFIKPQKTNDITKIKGWRRKQFFLKNPTIVEDYAYQPSSRVEVDSGANKANECSSGTTTVPTVANSTAKNSNPDLRDQPSCSTQVEREVTKKMRRKQSFVEKPTIVEFFCGENPSSSLKIEDLDPGNKENAFVYNGLDYFLDNEAELKLNYEIPHLYAEVGIKLTSDDIFSKPNLSEEAFKEVETKYCVPVKTELSDSELKEIERGLAYRSEEEGGGDVKMIKSEDGRRRKIRTKKHAKENSCKRKKPKNVIVTQGFIDLLNSLSFVRKCVGLEIFPKLGKPLHPIIRQHLNKLRSYHTKIDKEWANFATSVVCPNANQNKRFILPVYICGKTNDEPTEQNGESEVKIISEKINKVYSKEAASFSPAVKPPKSEKPQKECSKKIKMTDCRVVLERVKTPPNAAYWCMDHCCYNCKKCGLLKPFINNVQKPKKKLTFGKNNSVQGTFEKNVALLLAKKLKHIKLQKDVLVGIDSLKNLKPNVLELVKLNFIKKSFLSNVIHIWYLKPKLTNNRSRAFLTFSQRPPVPNAINIKNKEIPSASLPKVITDIMSAQDLFESNEYAILHCNGRLWEIHGSLSLGFEKNEGGFEKNVEQIFSINRLVELEYLQNLSKSILNVRCSKWWVLDLNQKFFELKIKTGPQTDVMIPKKFFKLDSLDSKFMPLRKYESGRTLGAYMLQNLMPYVLIGPFHLFENHELYLKRNSSPLPFMYFGEENSGSKSSLKFFIKSVIAEYESNGKKLCGLWLYDKIMLDNTCYLEVNLVTNSEHLIPKKYSIEMEHGYSINSGSSIPEPSTESSIVSSKKKFSEVSKKITVYLYFEVFDLGYIVGELQPDNSIIISHPLDPKTKVKSDNIGNWFIEMLRKKIYFIPLDLTLMSFVTKHKDDLRDRLPFNKFILGGAHILCKKGLYFMLELTDEIISELDLDKKEVSKAINSSKTLTEVKELRNLASILSTNSKSNDNLPLEKILTMLSKFICSSSLSKTFAAAASSQELRFITESLDAISEVKETEKTMKFLESAKTSLLTKKLKLISQFLFSVASSGHSSDKQVEVLMKVKKIFVDESENVASDYVHLLEDYKFGNEFIAQLKSKDSLESDKNSTKPQKSLKKLGKSKKQLLTKALEKKLNKLITTAENESGNLESQELKKLFKKMKIISNQLQSINTIFEKVRKKEIEDKCRGKNKKKPEKTIKLV